MGENCGKRMTTTSRGGNMGQTRGRALAPGRRPGLLLHHLLLNRKRGTNGSPLTGTRLMLCENRNKINAGNRTTERSPLIKSQKGATKTSTIT